MKTTEERVLQLEDERAIRSLAEKFADATTIADHEEFKTLWKPDGVFTINQPANTSKTGIEDISKLIMDLRDEKDFFVQFIHSGVIHIEGNLATARWVIHEVGQGPGEKYYSNYGVFNDEMEKIIGKWVYISRVYDYMWIDTSAFAGKPLKLPAYF